ncbi:MAG: hypothetical protein R2828_10385 [Saprospiraceae bacterium]
MDLIVNGKKLSIKHYLNLNLKPSNVEGVDLYPLYSQVIYESNSTKFKAFHFIEFTGSTIFCSKDEEPRILDESFLKDEKELRKTDEKILKIVEYEILKYKNEFSLKGLGKRIPIYGSSVLDIVTDSLGFSMLKFLGSKFTHNEYLDIFGENEPFVDKVAKAIALKPDLLNSMPRHLQYYSIVSILTKVFNDSTRESITGYDLLLGSKRKDAFYNNIRQIFPSLNSKDSSIQISNPSLDELFAVIPTLIDEKIKAMMN